MPVAVRRDVRADTCARGATGLRDADVTPQFYFPEKRRLHMLLLWWNLRARRRPSSATRSGGRLASERGALFDPTKSLVHALSFVHRQRGAVRMWLNLVAASRASSRQEK